MFSIEVGKEAPWRLGTNLLYEKVWPRAVDGPGDTNWAPGWEYESLVSLCEGGRPLVLRRHQHSTRGRPSTDKNPK